jgi:hypothetical protein
MQKLLLTELEDVYYFAAGLHDEDGPNEIEEGLQELLLDLTVKGRHRAEWEYSIADSFEHDIHAPLIKHAQPDQIGKQTPGYQIRPYGPLQRPTGQLPPQGSMPVRPSIKPGAPQFKPPGRPQEPPKAPPPFQLTPSVGISQALQHRRELAFEYTNVYNGQTNTRLVKPLRTFVAKTTGNFVLLTWDLVRVDWRCFVVSRVRKLQLGKKFIVDRNKLRDEIRLHLLRKEIHG